MERFDPRRLLGLRTHIQIAHHIPGRIRLRLLPSVLGSATGFDRRLLQLPFAALKGIRSVRINPAALTAVIEYDTAILPADWWQTAIAGSEDQALALAAPLQRLWGDTIGSWRTGATIEGAAA